MVVDYLKYFLLWGLISSSQMSLCRASEQLPIIHYVLQSSQQEIKKELEEMNVGCEIVRRSQVTDENGEKVIRIRKLNVYQYIQSLLDLETYTTVFFMAKVHNYKDYERPYNFHYCLFHEKNKEKEGQNIVFYYPGLTSGPYSFFEIKGLRDIRNYFRAEKRASAPIWISFSLSPLLSFSEEGVFPLVQKEVMPYLLEQVDWKNKEEIKEMNKIGIGASLGGGNLLHHVLVEPDFFSKAIILGGNLADLPLFDKIEKQEGKEEGKEERGSYLSTILSWPSWFLESTLDVLNTLFPFNTLARPFKDDQRQRDYEDYLEKSNANPFWVKLALWNARRRIGSEEILLKNNPFTLIENKALLSAEKKGPWTQLLFSVGQDDELGVQMGMAKFCDIANSKNFSCELDLINSHHHQYNFWEDPIYYPILRLNGHLILNTEKIVNFIDK